MTFRDQLITIDACEKAIDWVADKTLAEAWQTCERGDWMLWLASRLLFSNKLVVLASCDCARLALHLIPPGEERPRLAIEAAEAWCRGAAREAQVTEAGSACDNVEITSDSRALLAAQSAAYTVIDHTYAEETAVHAAFALRNAIPSACAQQGAGLFTVWLSTSARANAFADALRACAGIVRARIPFDTITEAYHAWCTASGCQ